MGGLVPAIHVFLCRCAPDSKNVDARNKRGMTTERLTQLSENRCTPEPARLQ
jgi:hypothetical protein